MVVGQELRRLLLRLEVRRLPRHRREHREHDHHGRCTRRRAPDDAKGKHVLEEGDEARLGHLVGAAALGDRRRRLELRGGGAERVAATLAAPLLRVRRTAAGAAEARLHLEVVVVQHHDCGEKRHHEHVVDQNDEGREDPEQLQVGHLPRRHCCREERGARRERRDEHGEARAAVDPRHACRQVAVHLSTRVEGLLPRVDKDKGVVGADSEHDVDGEEELERDPLDLQHHRREEDGGAEGEELLGEGGKGDQERAGVQPDD
mmetsp:Transcript_47483/g.154125  ORF Transcript_47483/g.154125 Transcript_47483/m.154125 type:complete len:261 (-) Transcript_47483:1440-2222(-)